MKKIILVSALLSIFVCIGKCQTPPEKPNIIFIIADDISQEDIGCYGNSHIKTPHIDAIANEGLRFTHMYVTSSSCSPSRSSILTSRYPHNTGAAELSTELPADLIYFPELLRHVGYYTALAGKWHEGKNTARAYDTLLVDRVQNGEGGEEQWLELLRNRPKNKPFMFWLAAYDAHRTWSADAAFEKVYRPEEVRVPPTLLDTKKTREDLALYYNEISRLDAYVGEIRQELKEQGILDNTIVIFMADNGRAFPGSKTRLLDRGTLEPFLISWPHGIAHKGCSADALVSSIDIAPTLLELAGVGPVTSFQGRSFSSLLNHPDEDFRTYIFTEHNWHDYEAYERAVRTKDFLYIVNERSYLDNGGPLDVFNSASAAVLRANRKELNAYQADMFLRPRPREEFYDNRKDPLQQSNLIADKNYVQQIDHLRSILKQWQKETGDDLPDNLTPDWYDRESGRPLPQKGIRKVMPGKSRDAIKINVNGPFE
ncbi:sulfatase [Olivibacter sp. CPCC 100613]|uniref:sulfatase family protein n=1 Tax=Olivibacter sp. CPCC 100613 TaxID=3079931 RepID=UPI002FF6642C